MTKRPLFMLAVMLVLGEFLRAYIGRGAVLIAAGMFVPAVFLLHKEKKKAKKFLSGFLYLLIPVFFLWGIFLYERAAIPDILLRNYREKILLQDIYVEADGMVSRIEEKSSGLRIYFNRADIIWGNYRYSNQGIVWITDETPEISIGSYIHLSGKLEQFSKPLNPGEFDSYSYYKSKGYEYCMRSPDWQLAGISNHPYQILLRKLADLRKLLAERMEKAAGKDSGILRAIFLAEKNEVDEDIIKMYQEQGIAHLLSVSGLHISILAMSVYQILRRISGSYAVAAVFGGIFAFLYVLMIGSPLSGTRALIMYLFAVTAAWRGRIIDVPSSIGASAIITLICHPLALFQSPFLLSYSAVLGIGVLAPLWKKWFLPGALTKSLTMASLQLAMLPVLLYEYYEYPLYSVLINQFAVPFGSILLVCAVLSSLFGQGIVGRLAGVSAHIILKYYEMLCHIFSKLPFSRQVNGRPAPWRLCVYAAVLFAFILLSNRRSKKQKNQNLETVHPKAKKHNYFVTLCAWLSVITLCLFLRADPVQKLTITMLDVGQGDCFLIELPGKIDFLCDAGSSSKRNIGQYTLEPVLLSKGIKTLDFILLTHADEDHISGVRELLERNKIKIKALCLPDYKEAYTDFSDIITYAKKNEVPVFYLNEGDTLNINEGRLYFLNPKEDEVYTDINATSLVFRLEYKNFSALFTGDISIDEEMDTGPVDLLKAAHHGSKYSNSKEWLMQLDPDAALISCGKNNRYGHPHAEVLERLKDVFADVYITAGSGAIEVLSDGITMKVNYLFQ